MFSDSEYFGFLGGGYSMLFDYLKIAIIISISILFTSGLFNIISSYMSHDCISIQKLMNRSTSHNMKVRCELNYFTILTVTNKISNQ